MREEEENASSSSPGHSLIVLWETKEGGEVCGLLQNEDKAPADRNQPLLVHHRIPSKLDLICAEWRRGNLSKQVIAGRDHKAKEDGVTAVTTLETVITEAISL